MNEPALPPFPDNCPRRFRSTVHGTVFGDRAQHLETVRDGDCLALIPDPPIEGDPDVWVHLQSGEPVGHLPHEIGEWLAPWLHQGGRASALVLRIEGAEAPSWRRLLLEVSCG